MGEFVALSNTCACFASHVHCLITDIRILNDFESWHSAVATPLTALQGFSLANDGCNV